MDYTVVMVYLRFANLKTTIFDAGSGPIERYRRME